MHESSSARQIVVTFRSIYVVALGGYLEQGVSALFIEAIDATE